MVDRERYLPLFVTESRKRLADATQWIPALPMDAGPEGGSALSMVSRAFHTLKGMSATMGYDALHHLAHEIEELCQGVRTGALAVDPPLLDLLSAGVDRMTAMVEAAEAGGEPEHAIDLEHAVRAHLRREGNTGFLVLEPPPEAPAEPELAPGDDASLAAIAELMAVAQRLRAGLEGDPTADARRIEAATRTIFAALARARQVSFDTVVPPLRKQFRKVCARERKEAQFEVVGGGTLVDPTVLGALQGAIVQLLNNAAVHGIEGPEERRRVGKPSGGLVRLLVDREGDHLRIVLADDGAGFPVRELIAVGRARRPPVAAEEDEKTEHFPAPTRAPRAPRGAGAMRDAIDVAFSDGVTTVAIPGPDAGRGEGLGAVRQLVVGLGGRLETRSVAGRGTTFTLVVPVQQRFEELLLAWEDGRAWAVPSRLLLDPPDAHAVEGAPVLLRFAGGVERRVSRVLGVVEGLVSPPPFPFNLLPQVTGTTVGPDGTILFVLDPTQGART